MANIVKMNEANIKFMLEQTKNMQVKNKNIREEATRLLNSPGLDGEFKEEIQKLKKKLDAKFEECDKAFARQLTRLNLKLKQFQDLANTSGLSEISKRL